MKLNDMLRLIAGVFVLLAIILGATVHPYWNYLAVLVAANSDSVGVYRLVSDDGASEETRCTRVTGLVQKQRA